MVISPFLGSAAFFIRSISDYSASCSASCLAFSDSESGSGVEDSADSSLGLLLLDTDSPFCTEELVVATAPEDAEPVAPSAVSDVLSLVPSICPSSS